MQYTMVNSYRTTGPLDLLTWVIVRERDNDLGTWTLAAYPFSAAGDAVACIEDGTLDQQVECTQIFYFDLKCNGTVVFVDDMTYQSSIGEGPFPNLNWRTA